MRIKARWMGWKIRRRDFDALLERSSWHKSSNKRTTVTQLFNYFN